MLTGAAVEELFRHGEPQYFVSSAVCPEHDLKRRTGAAVEELFRHGEPQLFVSSAVGGEVCVVVVVW